MRLSQRNEWIIIAVLIAYIAFTPGIEFVKNLMGTSIGKALMLSAIVFVWKYVSPIVAVLLVINYIRCTKMKVWEMMENPAPEPSATCAAGYTFDTMMKNCRNTTSGSDTQEPVSWTCPTGYAYDGPSKTCSPTTAPAQDKAASAPLPPAASAPTSSAAPAMPATSMPTIPMTTGSAAGQAALSMPPTSTTMSSAAGGVQPTGGAIGSGYTGF